MKRFKAGGLDSEPLYSCYGGNSFYLAIWNMVVYGRGFEIRRNPIGAGGSHKIAHFSSLEEAKKYIEWWLATCGYVEEEY